MLDESQREYVRKATVTLQIITAALASGVLVFAGVVFFLSPTGDQGEKDLQPILTYAAAAFGIVALFSAVVVPRLMDSASRKNLLDGNLPQYKTEPPPAEVGDVGVLVSMYQMRLIVGAAILEGAAFFILTAHMIEGQTVNLMMTALLLVAIFFKFPTRSSVENWVERERKTIEELRSLQG